MDYELCKKLKDAGFPVKEYKTLAESAPGCFVDATGIWLPPTLEELIEKCGSNIVLWEFSGVYYAGKANAEVGEIDSIYVDSYPKHTNQGLTATEAVANLYLALNQKKAT